MSNDEPFEIRDKRLSDWLKTPLAQRLRDEFSPGVRFNLFANLSRGVFYGQWDGTATDLEDIAYGYLLVSQIGGKKRALLRQFFEQNFIIIHGLKRELLLITSVKKDKIDDTVNWVKVVTA